MEFSIFAVQWTMRCSQVLDILSSFPWLAGTYLQLYFAVQCSTRREFIELPLLFPAFSYRARQGLGKPRVVSSMQLEV